MILLGVDPGSRVTGYGIIGRQDGDQWFHIASGVLSFSAADSFFDRLKTIYSETVALIGRYSPDQVVFEDVFYGQNIKSMLQLGQARGAALVAALNCDRPLYTYAAREIKQALTGNGAASKEQVRRMVMAVLHLDKAPAPLDVSDALAIALCHGLRFRPDKSSK